MTDSIPIPISLSEAPKDKAFTSDIIDLLPSNLSDLSAHERNRLFSLVSDVSGSTLPSLTKAADEWNHYLRETDPERYGPSPKRHSESHHLPRSRLLDSFFSHQIPMYNEKSFTKVGHLIQLQDHIIIASRYTSQQIHLAMGRLASMHPELQSLIPISTEAEGQRPNNEAESFAEPPCPQRIMRSSVALVVENTDGVTADLSNGAALK